MLEQAVWYATFVRELELWPSVVDTFRLYLDFFDGELAVELLQVVAFVGLGCAMCFALISQTAKKQMKTTMGVLETLRDKPGIRPATEAPSAPVAPAAEPVAVTEENLILE